MLNDHLTLSKLAEKSKSLDEATKQATEATLRMKAADATLDKVPRHPSDHRMLTVAGNWRGG